VNAAQDPRQPLGRQVGRFPGGDLTRERGVDRRLGRDPKQPARLSKPLIVGGQVARLVLMSQVQQDGVGEIEAVCLRQVKGRRGRGRIQIE
jgi:hypothetical protein